MHALASQLRDKACCRQAGRQFGWTSWWNTSWQCTEGPGLQLCRRTHSSQPHESFAGPIAHACCSVVLEPLCLVTAAMHHVLLHCCAQLWHGLPCYALLCVQPVLICAGSISQHCCLCAAAASATPALLRVCVAASATQPALFCACACCYSNAVP